MFVFVLGQKKNVIDYIYQLLIKYYVCMMDLLKVVLNLIISNVVIGVGIFVIYRICIKECCNYFVSYLCFIDGLYLQCVRDDMVVI